MPRNGEGGLGSADVSLDDTAESQNVQHEWGRLLGSRKEMKTLTSAAF